MAKLTKQQTKLHNAALDLLQKEHLSYDEKVFIYEHWNEAANNNVSQSGSHFTPLLLANDFEWEILSDNNIIDLCAGVGMLSFCAYHHCRHEIKPKITCLELNPDYVEIGKKLLPEANWICGSVLNRNLIESLGKFKQVISNPPFGKIKGEDVSDWLKYRGSEFDLKVVEVGSKIAEYGTFILPVQSTPFKFSGAPFYVDYQHPLKNDYGTMPQKVKKFIDETGFEYIFNLGIDTSIFKDDWKNTTIVTEIVNFDYSGNYF